MSKGHVLQSLLLLLFILLSSYLTWAHPVTKLRRIRRDDFGYDPSRFPRDPTSVADDTTCKLLYPCKTATINGSFHFEKIPDDKERQSEQEKGQCYKHPADQEPSEEIQLKSHCYDPDPPAEDIDPNLFKPITISRKIPEDPKNDGYQGVGFMLPPKPIFRFSQFFDIDKVEDSYKDENGLLEYEVIDWPGKTYKDHASLLMDRQEVEGANLGALKPCLQMLEYQGRSNKYLNYACNEDDGLNIAGLGLPADPRTSGTGKKSSERGKSQAKRKRTDLNGSEPVESGSTNVNEESNDDSKKSKRKRETTKPVPLCDESLVHTEEVENPPDYNPEINLRCNRATNRNRGAQCAHWPLPEGRFHLVSGSRSIVKDYIQPLFIGEDILSRLIQNPASPDLPSFGGKKLQCTEYFSADLRIILDFAFATDRLILGMKCGVVIVKNLNSDNVQFDIAYLKSSDRIEARPDTQAYHRFPFMINVVAATPCCRSNKLCRHLKPIVAIYSSYAIWMNQPDGYNPGNPKTIFVSWDNGDNFDRKVVASDMASINLIYWMYSKIPKWRMKDARAPHWINQLFEETKTLENRIDLNTIQVDPVTKLILQNVEDVQSFTSCDELVSMNSVTEENLLLVLCRDRQKNLSGITGQNKWSNNSYQIFTIRLHESIPMVSLTRRSKRKFSCNPSADFFRPGVTVEPTLVRAPNSYSIFILGCDKTIYSSGNGGKTLFTSAFYFNDATEANENQTNYVKSRQNQYLTEFPSVAIDPKGQTIMLTFGRYFAYGIVVSSTEMSFVSGTILKNLPEEHKGEVIRPIFIPYYNGAGVVGVGMPYVKLLKSSKEPFFKDNYKGRLALRLLDTSLSVHENSLPFYSDYPDVIPTTRHETLKRCTTYKFRTNVTTLSMDIGESQAIHVTVENNLKELPLNVLLTHDKAASIQVFASSAPNRTEQSAVLVHEWDIVLQAKPYIVDRQTAQINAFFGSEYNNLEAVSAHLIAGTAPQIRCHVQPQQHVNVRFGCSKYMKVHEDERRLQCEGFREDFKYEIKMGHYDEEMAALWVKERPQFYKIENGTLKVTYDYETFGCPVEPYRLDPYIPDLRLMPLEGSPNTTEGEKFLGNFVLIEIFGTSGYSYSKKVKVANCKRAPQNLEKMIKEWKLRVEAARAAYENYPHFDFEPIYQPLNIWNRVNYKDCEKDQFGIIDSEDLGKTDTEIDQVQDSPYEIMSHGIALKGEELNKLVWDQYLRQRVYIFMAVAVDPYNSFCNYHTFFGLSIAVPKEEPDIILICIFVCTVLLLLFLIVLGYYVRRHHVRGHFYKEAMYNRLLTAAWNLSFRYEKLLGRVKTNDPDVKQQVMATKNLKFRKHTGVAPNANDQHKTGLMGLRHRLRQ